MTFLFYLSFYTVRYLFLSRAFQCIRSCLLAGFFFHFADHFFQPEQVMIQDRRKYFFRVSVLADLQKLLMNLILSLGYIVLVYKQIVTIVNS